MHPSSIPTEDLFKQAIEGDLEAQTALLSRGYTAMTNAARRQMGPESQDTLDVASDAWLRFQSRWANWRGTGSFEHYAAGFVHNAMLDLYRRRARLLLREAPGIDLQRGDIEQNTDFRRLLERVSHAIEALPERQRQAFTRHLQGQTPERISAEMGVAEATVRVHVRNARRALVRRLFKSQDALDLCLQESTADFCLT